jgi:hypothetical protein
MSEERRGFARWSNKKNMGGDGPVCPSKYEGKILDHVNKEPI